MGRKLTPVGKPLHVLLLSDSENDSLLVTGELRKGGFDPSVDRIDTLEALEKVLASEDWDVAISNYSLRRFGAPEALDLLKKSDTDLPFIVISSRADDAEAVLVMRKGAHDYVARANLARLASVVERELLEAEVRRERKRAEADLVLERQRLEDIIAHANCGLLLLDNETRVTYVNKLVEDWFGPAEKLKGRFCWDVFQHDDPERQCAGLKVVRTGRLASGDTFTTVSGGRKKHFYVVATPVRDSRGQLRQITEVVVDITERKQAEEQLRRRNRELLTLYRISEVTSGSQTLQSAYKDIVEEISSVTGFPVVVIEHYDEKRKMMVFAGMTGIPMPPGQEVLEIPVEETLSGIVARTGLPMVETRAWDRPEYSNEKLRQLGVQTFVCVPMIVGGRTIGTLSLAHPERVEIDYRLPHWASTLANYIAWLTERKRAEEERSRLASIVESSDDAIIGKDLDGTIISWNHGAEKMYGYAAEEAVGRNISILFPPEQADELEKFLAKSDLGHAIENYETRRITKDGKVLDVSITVSPIRDAEGRIIGASTIARDITERKQGERLSDALNQVNGAIGSTLDLDEILQYVSVGAAEAIGAEKVAIYLREQDQWVVSACYGFPRELIGTRYSDKEAPFAATAARTRNPVLTKEAQYDERTYCRLISEYDIKSLLVVPLILKKEIVGAILIGYHRAPVSFTQGQVDFAQKLASSVSLAIENARLFAVQREIADTLQLALLTVPEEIEGIEFGHLYRSATEAALIGGDFYDLFELEHNQVGILVGDVSGKGIEASGLASVVRQTMKAYSYQEYSPARILRRTSEAVEKTARYSTFVTAFFAILHKTTGKLTYCTAGHPPPLIKRKNKSPKFLRSGFPALGLGLDAGYEDHSEVLAPGEILLIYTDGVTEARSGQALFGEERLMRAVRETREPASRLPEALAAEIESFSGGRFADDIAVLAISLKV